ncbi:MAG TPA: MBL fold metallo-hydrolase [Bryobacteraceae bacterium]|nr:MBL fold metallo-hydrolase [Bryobacteraceae bacterium]
MNRRDVLRTAAGVTLGVFAPRRVHAQQSGSSSSSRTYVIHAGGANVVAFPTGDGLVLVDSGASKSGDEVMASLKEHAGGAKVRALFNTHYHLDQTANNELFAAAGAKIIAHERTRQWMATPYWVPAEDRYEKARSKMALPTATFLTTGSLNVGDEQIDYGYLLLAHTSGDIYVHFKNANLLAVGDVASPLRDPALDWFTGAWIGGRVDAMDQVLKLADDQTFIVPAYGPMLTRAEFKAERDMMDEVRSRLFKLVKAGQGPQDMLDQGVLKGLPRTWKDPSTFVYAAAKGLWAHHDKLGPDVV